MQVETFLLSQYFFINRKNFICNNVQFETIHFQQFSIENSLATINLERVRFYVHDATLGFLN